MPDWVNWSNVLVFLGAFAIGWMLGEIAKSAKRIADAKEKEAAKDGDDER